MIIIIIIIILIYVNFVNLVCDNSFPSIKISSFLLNPFLFPDKTLSSLCQNHTSDDNEKNKTKSKIHTDIYPRSSFPLHLFITFSRQFCQPTNCRTLYSIKSSSFLLCPFNFFSGRNFEPFVFSDDDEE